MEKDIYTIENDFTDIIGLFDKALHKQVIYSDKRLFQSFILEWKNYRILDTREFINNLKNDEAIMNILSNVQPFACYGFASNKLAITFKQGLVFEKTIALSTLKYIIKIGSNQNEN
ncbi:hypothetical protein [Chryseobacterium sp. WLY505]|uniref:hypothetical protein n=1 Tax=Chryseobacterium sp. WLY505 TaxID=3068892 RepID=UPI00279693DB|nr:hypothetical protein [Chryseobacterium sp. WLY505]MDQ1859277.1 hypothetical protein [Chryseobacterium sp. WLY505]